MIVSAQETVRSTPPEFSVRVFLLRVNFFQIHVFRMVACLILDGFHYILDVLTQTFNKLVV